MDMPPKLIASDIDGTLLPRGEIDIPARVFPLLRRLTERGVLFCPASGRQYHSLRRLFAPVADEMYYLCENGSILFGPGAEETAYRQLWRRFYDAVAIRERENPRLRMSRMPKRYWSQMTELRLIHIRLLR